MKFKPTLRLWYVSHNRLFELVDRDQLDFQARQALDNPTKIFSPQIINKFVGPRIMDYIQKEKIFPFYRLALENQLQQGIRFTYDGHFHGKGFSVSNRSPLVSLSENVNDFLPGKKLILEFSKDGLISNTAYSRLSGRVANLFTFCSISEIEKNKIRAVPYCIGDLVESSTTGLDMSFAISTRLPVENIDQFRRVDFTWNPSPQKFAKLKDIPEKKVKEVFCGLLKEIEIPKDWGGEECDIFSCNLSVDGKRLSAAFLLKGPAKFHEMTLADCGKNGDQIYRLFNIPADVYVLQHCHKVSPAVRKTMEVFTSGEYKRSSRFTIIDGYDTARILRAKKLL